MQPISSPSEQDLSGEKSLVSVIMIFLNAQEFIREAIDSVYAQTYEAWELILVDDGSSDESAGIARRCAENDPGRVCYLEHEGHRNRGMSASRNLGISHAKGDFIAFLDSDDVWLPEKLEQQVEILRARPEVGMVYGPTQWWYSWTGLPEDQTRDFIHDLGVRPHTLLQPPELLDRFLRQEGISPCTCSILIRREAVERVGGFEESFPGLYEDQAFFAKISLAERVWVAPECTCCYRQHPNSNCSVTQQAGEQASIRFSFLKWLADYLETQGRRDPEVWKALRIERVVVRFPALFRIYNRARQGLPGRLYRAVIRIAPRGTSLPLIRHLRWAGLRRLTPLGNGLQRGTPIVRYYWDIFLRQYQADIQGATLEIGGTNTIREYGGQAVTRADAVDLSAHSPEVTLVADLSRADHLAANAYDCFINQFTMHLIYDVEAALYHSVRLLKPGGVLLANFPCVDYYFPKGLDMGTGKPLFMYWWFTPLQVENLLRGVGLKGKDYSLEVYGNLLTRMAYQLNLPAEELTRKELEYGDPGHPLLVCVRVVKPLGWTGKRPLYRDAWQPESAPAKWNPETGHYGS